MSDGEEHYFVELHEQETALENEADEVDEAEYYYYFRDSKEYALESDPVAVLVEEEEGDAASNISDESQQADAEGDVAEKAQSNPTDIWSRTEFERGFLVSHGPDGSIVANAADAYKVDFTEYATQHLDWRVYALSSNQPTETKDEFVDLLYHWATHYEHVRGKWMIFADPAIADALWTDICVANSRGRLGGYCEVRPRNRQTNTHFISVYCPDFNDTAACKRVLRALAGICARHGARVSSFKPDFLTTLGVYRAQNGTPDVDVRYTYGELGLDGVCVPKALRSTLAALGGGGSRKTTRRGSRSRRSRGRRTRAGADGGPFANPYASNERHTPSRPNGIWSADEAAATFIVHHGPYGSPYANYTPDFVSTATGLLDEYRARSHYADATEKRRLMRSLYSLAGNAGLTCGKWKVFAPPEVADQLWEAIRVALDEGRLGAVAKVSMFNPRSGKFLICVYCNDFRDVDDCRRVLYSLHTICVPFRVPVVANFKCDFLSHLGVYATQASEHNRIGVRWPLPQLGLGRHWANEALKEVLDELKDQVR